MGCTATQARRSPVLPAWAPLLKEGANAFLTVLAQVGVLRDVEPQRRRCR